MYVDPITRQTFEYASQIPCENNPQNVISLDPDTDQCYVLAPQPINKDPPLLFEPTQVQTVISPNIFLLKMLVFFLKKNSNIFGTVYYSLNTLILLFSFLVKLFIAACLICNHHYIAARLIGFRHYIHFHVVAHLIFDDCRCTNFFTHSLIFF